MARYYREHCTIKNEENNLDPDDAKFTWCFACKLPIFSTPFKSFPPNTPLPFGSPDFRSPDTVILHDECAKLPQELHGHVLHPQPLILCNENLDRARAYCVQCYRSCRVMYECPDSHCQFHLDLVCAGQIRILHRIHHHRLTPRHAEWTVFASPSSYCDVCGVHHGNHMGLYYMCNICSFRLNPECASVPNAIVPPHENHQHALRLSYHLDSSSLVQRNTCGICGGTVAGLGAYFCGKCRYYVHIKCVISDPQRFKAVLLRVAKFANVLHFPVEDEYTSVVRYILDNTTGDDWHPHQIEGELSPEEIHEHTLIFHDQDDNDQLSPRVCTACVRLISPPFYSCSICPNFFLHDCCARLPRKVAHPRHPEHAIHLSPTASEYDIPAIFRCGACMHYCSGFAYSCETCDFKMDVICTLMPPTITHDSHGKSHILYMSYSSTSPSMRRNCCERYGLYYECSSTCDFRIHAKCVALPRTIRHKHDQHPLKLTANSAILADADDRQRLICESCETSITDTDMKRCYSCSECDQFFHSECIPSANVFLKTGATIRVSCHSCPLALVRKYGFLDYKCGYCSEDISRRATEWEIRHTRYYEEWVYECSLECYFRIHEKCAKKCLETANK